MADAKNVLGTDLESCCTSPMTGYYRDGFCNTGGQDFGMHVVCAQVTAEFLEYTKLQGNDLSTAVPQFNFPGLRPGDSASAAAKADRWCLCAARWQEALEAGVAPPVVLAATHARAVEACSLEDLQKHAVN